MTTNTFVQSLKTTISERWIAITAILLIGLSILFLGGAIFSRISSQSVQDSDIVKIHYTLLVDGENTYFSTENGEPVEYALGQGNLLPDIEAALIGMRVGQAKTVRLAPEQAYGPRYPELVRTISREEFPEGSQPAVGQEILSETDNGSPIALIVTDVSDTTVTLDANHPLSGHSLTFEIELVGIEEGSPSSKQVY